MPNIISNNGSKLDDSMMLKDLGYKYPDRLDLRPGSDLHEKLRKAVLDRARESFDVMSKRYDNWRDIDDMLTGYIKPDKEELDVKEKDPRKPISIVVPMSYATMETLLTYFAAAFLENPIFRYEGVGPEDVAGAALLEHLIGIQVRKAKAALALHTMWRDSFAYGFGVVINSWKVIKAYRTKKVKRNVFSEFLGKTLSLGETEEKVSITRFEGNVLEAVDPYLFFPDPSLPIDRVQDMEYIGWLDRDTYMSLLNEEASDDDMFNVKYLQYVKDGRSQFFKRSLARDDEYRLAKQSHSNPMDVIYMFINLIPREWGLGKSDRPEKWIIALAADSVIIKASPLGLDHDMYPIAISAPDYDGHSVTPISRLEITYGLQEVINWLFNSHITNIRKAINDMFVVDPYLINMKDLKDPEAGKYIRLRKPVWGRGVAGAIEQLNVNDVTRQHIADAGFVMDLAQRTTAATDIMQGIMRRSSERRSATEARDVKLSALSRLERAAKITSIQAMYDLGYMMASNTIQLMTQKILVRASGELAEKLSETYGSGVAIDRDKIDVNFDVLVHDGSIPGGENGQLWIQLYQVMATNPEILQKFDIVKIFKHIARILGAKSVYEFENREVQANVVPDKQVKSEVDKGNLVSIDSILGGEEGGEIQI